MSPSFGDEKWWDAFQDDALRDLIRAALQQNYDVRIAAARILEARALLGIARADQLPAVNARGIRRSMNVLPRLPGDPRVETSPAPGQCLIRVGAGLLGQVPARHRVGSRQPSVGRVGAASSHQFARQRCCDRLFPVARTGPRTGDLTPDARVPKGLAAADATPCGPRRHVHARRAAGRTTRVTARAPRSPISNGGSSSRKTSSASSSEEILKPSLEAGALVDQPHPPEVPAGLPSSLLERRPDILQAEQQLVAANAQIGVAKADYFPQISLTAVGGSQSSALTRLFAGPAGLWTFGASALQPIFEGGRIRNSVRFAEARTQEATFVYQRTVQQAFREVSDALVAYRKSQEVRIQQQQLTRAARRRDQAVEHALPGRRRELPRSPGQRDAILCGSTRARAGSAPRAPVIGRDLSLARRRMAAVRGGGEIPPFRPLRTEGLRPRGQSVLIKPPSITKSAPVMFPER